MRFFGIYGVSRFFGGLAGLLGFIGFRLASFPEKQLWFGVCGLGFRVVGFGVERCRVWGLGFYKSEV